MIYTTLNAIRECSPCEDGWKKLLKHLGKTAPDDEPLALVTVLHSNGISDALWCLRAVEGHDREIRLYIVGFARQVQHLLKDPRSHAALDVAERHANGEATDAELAAAQAAAWAAAGDAAGDAEAGDMAWAAARAAAQAAVWDVARAAAEDMTAGDMAWAAAGDEEAGDMAWSEAWSEAWAAARAAAWAAVRAAQAKQFRKVFG